MLTFPRHGTRKRQHRFDGIEEVAVPVRFQNAPAAFNRVVLAVIGRIIRQHQSETRRVNELNKARQKLRAATVALRSVVEIEQEGLDLGEPRFVALPPQVQNVHQTITGDFGSHGIQAQRVVLGQQHSYRRHPCLGVKVMVGGMDFHPVLAPTGVRSDLDRCLGIYGEAQYTRVGIGIGVDAAQLVKEGVGLGNLFLGRLFCTVLG